LADTACPAGVAAAVAGFAAGADAAAARCWASAATRACSSASRSGARPAHSRNRFTSRAWAKYNSDSTPSPSTQA
jgi:hypothetical protein